MSSVHSLSFHWPSSRALTKRIRSPSRTYAALEILARSRDDDKAHYHFAYGYPAHLRRDGMGRNRPLQQKVPLCPFRACRPVTANLKASRRNGVSSIPRGRTGTHRIKSAIEQVRAGHDARHAATMAGHGARYRPRSPRDFPPCVPVDRQIAPHAGAGHLGQRLDRIVTMAQNGPATSFQSTRKSTT
jgi:hypothetical protein